MTEARYQAAVELLWYLSVSGQIFALALHWRNALIKVFPAWSLFLASSATCSLLLINVSRNDPRYVIAWAGCNAFTALVLCGSIYESLRMAIDQYPNIGDRAPLFKGGVAIAAVLLLALPNEPWKLLDGSARQVAWCVVMFVRKYVCLAAALLLIVAWLAVFRSVAPALSQNLRRHCWLLATYCSAVALMFWAYTLGADRRVMNLCITGFPTVLYYIWAFTLTKNGEARMLRIASEHSADRVMADWQQWINRLRILRIGIQRGEHD